jgi:hypothetical protein
VAWREMAVEVGDQGVAALASRGVHVHHMESGRGLAEHENRSSGAERWVGKARWRGTRQVRETGRGLWAFRWKRVNSRANYSRSCGGPEPSFSLEGQVIELGFHEDSAPSRLGALRSLHNIARVAGDTFSGTGQKNCLFRNEFAVTFLAESRTRWSLTTVSTARTSLSFKAEARGLCAFLLRRSPRGCFSLDEGRLVTVRCSEDNLAGLFLEGSHVREKDTPVRGG